MNIKVMLFPALIVGLFTTVLSTEDGNEPERESKIIQGYYCISGINDTKGIEVIRRYFRKNTALFKDGFIYHWTMIFKDSMDECKAMRDEELKKRDNHEEWHPVFIYDFSDDTLFDRLKINEMIFDNHQLFIERDGLNFPVEWESKHEWPCAKEKIREAFPNLKFDFEFDQWKSDVRAREIIDEFNDGIQKQQWEWYTGQDIINHMIEHRKYFEDKTGDRRDKHQDYEQAIREVFSDPYTLSKSFYAFNKAKQSGVVFVGEHHHHQPSLKMQVSMINALSPWMDTVYTEQQIDHFDMYLKQDKAQLLSEINQSPSVHGLTICPLSDPISYIGTGVLCHWIFLSGQVRKEVSEVLPACRAVPIDEGYTERLNFDNPEVLKSLRWENQYLCFFSQHFSMCLIRSMTMFNSLNRHLKSNRLVMVIQGASHTADNLDAMQGNDPTDLLRDKTYIRSPDTYIQLKKVT